jgi:hypothetical protein
VSEEEVDSRGHGTAEWVLKKTSILCILVDSYEAEFPDIIEEFLHHGAMKCIAFNCTGTLLAGNYLSLLVFK